MTYAVGGLIQASDYNIIVNGGAGNWPINDLWAQGSNEHGYGQSQIAPVSLGSTVSASSWFTMTNAITRMAQHQGTTITNFVTPATGEVVSYLTMLQNNINAIVNNRLNAVFQGSTTTNTITNNTITWLNSLTMSWTLTWAGDNQARYFFNAGGQIGLNFAHPDTSSLINISFRRIASSMGTVWLSSPTVGTALLGGTYYTGTTQVGGISTSSIINTTLGFYALTNTDQQMIRHSDESTSVYYYTNSYITVYARYSGTGILTITAVWSEIPAGSAVVAVGSVGTLTVRPPSTVFLSNSWQGPTVVSNLSGV